MFRTARTIAAIAIAAALVSGCSLLPQADGTQSVIQACLVMKPVLLSATSEMTSALDDLKSDPSGAPPLLHKVSGELTDAIADLTNSKVISVMTQAVDSLDAMTGEVEKALDGTPDQAALSAAGTQVQADFDNIDTVCAAG